MKITNKFGLPPATLNLELSDEYSRGDANISVTDLIDSPRVRVLEDRHRDELEIDVESCLRAQIGKAYHRALQGASSVGVAERRLSILVNGWVLSGGMDHYGDGVLTDYKVTNVFKAVYSKGGRIAAFDQQVNVYAEILRQNGFPVKKLMLYAVFTDWRRSDLRQNTRKGQPPPVWIPNQKTGWPEKCYAHYETDLWPSDKAKDFILSRIKAHQAAEKELPQCSLEEIWNGRRCSDYCLASPFCEQYQKGKKTGVM